MAYKGYRYVEEERRRRWAPAAATYEMTLGWADPRRRTALLVARVPGILVCYAPRALRGLRLGPARPCGYFVRGSKLVDSRRIIG